MKTTSALLWAWSAVALLATPGCGGGGGDSLAPAAAAPTPTAAPGPAATPSPAPTPAAPAPAPASAGTPGTWTAATNTCVSPINLTLGLSQISLGHIPCLAGTYYATVIRDGTSVTGPLIGKSCNLTIGLDGSFALAVDGIEQARLLKTVGAVVGGYEQSSTFFFEYWDAGPPASVGATKLGPSSSIDLSVDPLRRSLVTFQSSTSKLQINASYTPSTGTPKLLLCEG